VKTCKEEALGLLGAADLCHEVGSPVRCVFELLRNSDLLSGSELLSPPEVVSTEWNFDLLGTPEAHVTRTAAHTFYLETDQVLRSQSSIVWPYAFLANSGKARLEEKGEYRAFFAGKVYRNCRATTRGCPVFHQFDAMWVERKRSSLLSMRRLHELASEFYRLLFMDLDYTTATKPLLFCDPAIQLVPSGLAVRLEGVQGGLVRSSLLEGFGISSETYDAFAFGFGLDRIAMAMFNIPDARMLWKDNLPTNWDARFANRFYSKPLRLEAFEKRTIDISIVSPKDSDPDGAAEIVASEIASIDADWIGSCELIDEFVDDKRFGPSNRSLTFRVGLSYADADFTKGHASNLVARLVPNLEAQGFRIRGRICDKRK
jgi:phenylalanyl-tRNA synthetase alpha chain